LFIDAMLKSRVKTLYYDSKNKQMAHCKKIYNEYIRQGS